MVVIRLVRHGRKNYPFYKVVVSDKRRAVKGKFIETIGFFNPFTESNKGKIKIHLDRMKYWVSKGAQISERVTSLIFKFNLYMF